MATDVCVVSYRTPTELDNFLRSYSEFAPGDARLLVRLNDPVGEENYVVAKWDHMIDVLDTGENIGYARAVNRLVALGSSETVAIFNADIVLTADAIQNCQDALMAEDNWAVLGPKQIDDSGRITHAGIFGTNQAPAHRGWKEMGYSKYQDVKEAVTVSGSAYFIKRSVWNELSNCVNYKEYLEHSGFKKVPDEVGAFLPTKHYYEETFCSYHAREHGYNVVYYGPVSVTHLWHRSSRVGDPSSDGQMKASQAIFRAACDLHGISRD